MTSIAIIGEGVIGTSTALAIRRIRSDIEITVFHDRPFEDTCSAMPAGLFRFDNTDDREDAKATFEWYADLCRQLPGTVTGVKLLSGHIQSDSKEELVRQKEAYGDIVYNFRFMSDRERNSLFPDPTKYAIHFSSFAAEGNRYVPFLKEQSVKSGVIFKQRKITSVEELADEGFDVVVNCAGLNAGKLAGDGSTVYPIRGVVFQVEAAWHKHFNYRGLATFKFVVYCVKMHVHKLLCRNHTVVLGTMKEANRFDTHITEEDSRDIWERYEKLHPSMKGAKVLGEWCHLRPARPGNRVERLERRTKAGKPYTVVHHYGHGGYGFTSGWGTSLRAAALVEKALNGKAKI